MTLPAHITDREFDKFVESQGGDTAVRTLNIGSLVPDSYDYIVLTYVAAGNGAGEIETVTYKEGGAAGTTVATITLTYDASNRISTITKA